MKVPIFDMGTGEFSGEVVELDQDNFNLPLRRDIVHTAFEYYEHLGKKIWKLAKTKGDVAGSGKKPAPQKGRGMARVGNKRSPTRRGGGVAHGPVPRDLSYPIPHKKKLLALKTMLSAKLFEDRIVFIESADLDYPKTQLLEAIVKPFGIDKLCFVTAQEPPNTNLRSAATRLSNVIVKRPSDFNVPELLRNDYIFIDKQGLIDLEELLVARHSENFRNKKVPTPEKMELKKAKHLDSFDTEIIKPILESDEIADYDDDLPLQLQTESLRSYIDDLRKLQLDAA